MRVLILALFAASAQAFSPIAVNQRSSTSLDAVSRKGFLQAAVIAGAALAAPAAWADETTASGVVINVIKTGDGPAPGIGELAAIRFNAFNGDIKIDDIFDNPEPYYTRVGGGQMLKVRKERSTLNS